MEGLDFIDANEKLLKTTPWKVVRRCSKTRDEYSADIDESAESKSWEG